MSFLPCKTVTSQWGHTPLCKRQFTRDNAQTLYIASICGFLIRAKAACSHWTFPLTICWSVCLSVCLSACLSGALWQNGWSDIDAVWDGRSDGSRDEAGSWVWGSVHGIILGANVCNQSGVSSVEAPSQMTLGFLVIVFLYNLLRIC